ncbi:TIM barrel protein [Thermodesulfobacteriota bacterium]
MLNKSRFGLNRMVCPGLGLESFFRLTRELGLNKVELRNDLSGGKILDDYSPEEVNAMTDQTGIQVITINAIQHFNLVPAWDRVYEDVNKMIETARAIGCPNTVLCPNNDVQDTRTAETFYQDTVTVLNKLAPLFKESGITGLVEPLGFEECSLRSKDIAVKAIQEVAYDDYQLVHDTFHHYLGPDDKVQTFYTSLVHISGVEAGITSGQFRDSHRVLVGPADKVKNLEQIKALLDRGYEGDFFFEPFSEEIHQMDLEVIKSSIDESIAYIVENI